jgi:SRSO17 transposase
MSVSEWSGASLPWFEELAGLKERIGGLVRRAEPRRQVGLLLEGLIGGAERKNGWQLAEYAGDPAPWRMQALLGRTIWDQEKARDICRDYVMEHLGDPSGVLVLDETGFLKKGSHSAGVARQYSGTAGRIENCQIGVFLGYASPKGHALPPCLSAKGLDRGRGASKSSQYSRRLDVRHQAEDRHRDRGGGA